MSIILAFIKRTATRVTFIEVCVFVCERGEGGLQQFEGRMVSAFVH